MSDFRRAIPIVLSTASLGVAVLALHASQRARAAIDANSPPGLLMHETYWAKIDLDRDESVGFHELEIRLERINENDPFDGLDDSVTLLMTGEFETSRTELKLRGWTHFEGFYIVAEEITPTAATGGRTGYGSVALRVRREERPRNLVVLRQGERHRYLGWEIRVGRFRSHSRGVRKSDQVELEVLAGAEQKKSWWTEGKIHRFPIEGAGELAVHVRSVTPIPSRDAPPREPVDRGEVVLEIYLHRKGSAAEGGRPIG